MKPYYTMLIKKQIQLRTINVANIRVSALSFSVIMKCFSICINGNEHAITADAFNMHTNSLIVILVMISGVSY